MGKNKYSPQKGQCQSHGKEGGRREWQEVDCLDDDPGGGGPMNQELKEGCEDSLDRGRRYPNRRETKQGR
jgi:hypothetical protein